MKLELTEMERIFSKPRRYYPASFLDKLMCLLGWHFWLKTDRSLGGWNVVEECAYCPTCKVQ